MKRTMEGLNELRTAVDRVDAQIIELLKQRLALTQKMASLKFASGLKLRDQQREQAVLQALAKLNQQSEPQLPEDELAQVYRTIMGWSLRAQENLAEIQSSSRSQ